MVRKELWAAVIGLALAIPAAAHGGTVYVSTNSDIKRFDLASGTTLSPWTIPGPEGVALDSAGNLYASSYAGSYAQRFASNGSPQVIFGLVYHPFGIALDGSDNVYVANYAATYGISEFAPDGSPIRTIGAGAGKGAYYGLAFSSDLILYALNITDNTIERYNPGTGALMGTFIDSTTLGTKDTSGSIAFDSTGNLYTADYFSGNISEFTSGGAFFRTFASTGSGSGPIGIAFDSLGNLYVAGNLSNTIYKFASDGTRLPDFAAGVTQAAFIAIYDPPPAVPEPISMIFFGTGLVAVGGYAARRRLQQKA